MCNLKLKVCVRIGCEIDYMGNPRQLRLVVILFSERRVEQAEYKVGEQSEVTSRCLLAWVVEIQQKFQSLRMSEIFL